MNCDYCSKDIDISHPERVYRYQRCYYFDSRDCRERFVLGKYANWIDCPCEGPVMPGTEVYVDIGIHDVKVYCSDECFDKYSCERCYGVVIDNDDEDDLGCPEECRNVDKETDEELTARFVKYDRLTKIRSRDIDTRSAVSVFRKYKYNDVLDQNWCYVCGDESTTEVTKGVWMCDKQCCKNALMCRKCHCFFRRRKAHPLITGVISSNDIEAYTHHYEPTMCDKCSNETRLYLTPYTKVIDVMKKLDEQKETLLKDLLSQTSFDENDSAVITSLVKQNDYDAVYEFLVDRRESVRQ